MLLTSIVSLPTPEKQAETLKALTLQFQPFTFELARIWRSGLRTPRMPRSWPSVRFSLAELLSLALLAGARPAAEAATHVVNLAYREVPYTISHVSLYSGAASQRPVLTPEPRADGAFHGELLLGNDTNNAILYAWDAGRKRLHLDLNRNRDLTDDPAGIFPGSDIGPWHLCTNVHLGFRTPTGSRPVLVDLALDRYTRNWLWVNLRSFWEGKLSLQGKEWQVGLVEEPGEATGLAPRYLLLRPWAARTNWFALLESTPDLIRLPPRLYLPNQAYDLECRYETTGNSAGYRLQLREVAVSLGGPEHQRRPLAPVDLG
jgi:hypothetical protein